MEFAGYVCEDCGFATNTRQLLKNHQRIHSSFRKFQCHLCPQSFHFKHQMDTHLRIHTGNIANALGRR